jgi:hypothetical protein
MALTVDQLCSVTGYKKRYIIRLLNYGIDNIYAAKRMAKKLMIADYRQIYTKQPIKDDIV